MLPEKSERLLLSVDLHYCMQSDILPFFLVAFYGMGTWCYYINSNRKLNPFLHLLTLSVRGITYNHATFHYYQSWQWSLFYYHHHEYHYQKRKYNGDDWQVGGKNLDSRQIDFAPAAAALHNNKSIKYIMARFPRNKKRNGKKVKWCCNAAPVLKSLLVNIRKKCTRW